MILTKQQEQAVENGGAVSVTVRQTACVVLRKDVYDRVKTVLYDDSELTDHELHAIAARPLDDLETAGSIP